jgi:hypothetical protein
LINPLLVTFIDSTSISLPRLIKLPCISQK